MPYIHKEERTEENKLRPKTVGQLTWAIYCLLLWFVNLKGKSFIILCQVVGAPLCAILEIYRRVIAVQEDGKIKSNGDVVVRKNGDVF